MDFKQNQNFISRFRRFSNILSHISVIIVIFIYAQIQIQHFTPAYQEVDPDGYLLLAKRMARLQPLTMQDEDPFMYQTHQWVETPKGRVISKFSPGYPLLMALFYRIGGDEAMFVVSPLMGVLTLVGAYLLFQLWMSPLVAALGTWALALNPMFLIYTGYLLTHASNTCAVTWGMFFLWKWVRGKRAMNCFPVVKTTGYTRSGIWAGLLLGFAATVRHTSALMGIVVFIAIASRWMQDWHKQGGDANLPLLKQPLVKPIGILLICYAIFPLILAGYNGIIFGNPLVTGYSLTHEQDAFKLEYFRQNLPTMLGGLNTTALFLIFPIGLGGLLLVGEIWERLMRLFWFLPIVIFYTAYYWAPQGMAYIRFTICTFPVVIGSAFMLLERAANFGMESTTSGCTQAQRSTFLKWLNAGAMVLFLLLLVSVRYGEAQRGMRGVVSDPGSRATAAAGRMLSKTLQSDAVILSQPPFFCYIGTRENFRHYDIRVFHDLDNYGVRRQPEREKRLREFYASLDETEKINKKRELVQSFLAQSRQVAYLIPQSVLEKEKTDLGDEFRWTLLKPWEVESTPWGLYTVQLNPADNSKTKQSL